MFKKMLKLLAILLIASMHLNSNAKEFLRPEEAFQISAILSQEGLTLSFKAAPGYYMYQESIHAQTKIEEKVIILEPKELPKAIEKYDENFQKIVRTYKGEAQTNTTQFRSTSSRVC